MKRALTGILGLALLATVSGEAKQTDGASDVTVYMRISTMSTPGAIEQAKLMARHMFASIGVNIIWRTAGAESSEPPQGLSVNLLIGEGDPGFDDSGPLAEAYPFAGNSAHITVMYDRVHRAAGVCKELEPIILAHVLVHEITHVLQCLNRHADTGVMKAHWTSDDYYDMRWKPLPFTPEDIELIHLGIEMLRSRAAGAPPISPLSPSGSYR